LFSKSEEAFSKEKEGNSKEKEANSKFFLPRIETFEGVVANLGDNRAPNS
jgi:hypothetical protein